MPSPQVICLLIGFCIFMFARQCQLFDGILVYASQVERGSSKIRCAPISVAACVKPYTDPNLDPNLARDGPETKRGWLRPFRHLVEDSELRANILLSADHDFFTSLYYSFVSQYLIASKTFPRILRQRRALNL